MTNLKQLLASADAAASADEMEDEAFRESVYELALADLKVYAFYGKK